MLFFDRVLDGFTPHVRTGRRRGQARSPRRRRWCRATPVPWSGSVRRSGARSQSSRAGSRHRRLRSQVACAASAARASSRRRRRCRPARETVPRQPGPARIGRAAPGDQWRPALRARRRQRARRAPMTARSSQSPAAASAGTLAHVTDRGDQRLAAVARDLAADRGRWPGCRSCLRRSS